MPPVQAIETLNDMFADLVTTAIEISQVSRIIRLFANNTEIVQNETVSQ